MKKEELESIKLPLSRTDFEKLKKALESDEIERTDIPMDTRMEMDDMWAKDNEAIHEDYERRGIFGAYD